jgi:ABC-2 type transport system ATP-binding protein
MSEVQKTSDRVGLIRDGSMVAEQTVESLRASSMRTVEIEFAEPVRPEDFAQVPGVSGLTVDATVLRCRLDGPADALVKAAAVRTVVSITSEEPDLEDVFLQRYAGPGGAA